MCGIFGMISYEGTVKYTFRREWLEQACKVGHVRGEHSTGLYAAPLHKDKHAPILYKKALPGYDFAQLKAVNSIFQNTDYWKFLIGHHRFATRGFIDSENAHPFQHGHITLVHNGSLTYLSKLHKDFNKFSVDSEVLTYALSQESYKKVLPRLKGAAALAWHDEKEDSLFLFRNKERPMFYAKLKDEESILFASEYGMLMWLATRNGIVIENGYELKENQVLQFKDSTTPVSNETIEEEKEHTVVNFLPKYKREAPKGKINSKEVLESIGLSMKQEIKMVVDEIRKPDEKSKHGKGIGYMSITPFCDVSCYGLDLRKFKKGDIIKGNIIGVELSEYGTTPCIIIHNPEKTGETETPVIALIEDLSQEGAKRFKGPRGKFLTLEEFRLAVNDGCAYCTGNVNPAFDNVMDWTHDGQPVCHVCARDMKEKGQIIH